MLRQPDLLIETASEAGLGHLASTFRPGLSADGAICRADLYCIPCASPDEVGV